jgi:uncharacterized protein (TIGR02145 family)
VYVTTDVPEPYWDSRAKNQTSSGNSILGGDMSYCPGPPLTNPYVPAKGLIGDILTDAGRDFQYFNIYRDGNYKNGYLIGTTTDTSFLDTVPWRWNPISYSVTAMHDQGESRPAGPISVVWDSIPGCSVYPYEFYEELDQNQTSTKYFEIYNYGDADLLYSIEILYSSEENLPQKTVGESSFEDAKNEWLSVLPDTGSLTMNEWVEIEVNFDATGLVSGYYFAEIYIESNDPLNPIEIISVTLKVGNGLSPPSNLAAEINQATGQVDLSWEYEVPEGFYDNFEDGVADNWISVTGNWLIEDQAYKVINTIDYFGNSSYYNEDFSNFVFEVKMKFTTGSFPSAGIAFRGDPTAITDNGSWTNGYSLGITHSGYWTLKKRVNGELTSIQGLTFSSNINTGLNEWNIIKVVVSGVLIEVYINDIYHGGFNDDSFTSGKVGLNMYDTEYVGTAYYDYVSLSSLSDKQGSGIDNITSSFVSNNKTSGLDPAFPNNREEPMFQYFNIYRDGSIIGNSNELFYTDFLPYAWEIFAYEVAAVFNTGESDPAGPVEVYWEGMPSISVVPEEITHELMPGEIEITGFLINNFGEGDLSYSISIEELTQGSQGKNTSWLTVSPMEGSIPGGVWYFSSHQVSLDAESLSLGQYEADILITSNDPENPSVTLPVTLIVTNSPTLYADFDANPKIGNLPLTVDFTDLSVGSNIGWAWDFENDGFTDSYDQNPVWTYSEPGIYSVQLSINTPEGESDGELKQDFIVASDFQHIIDLQEGWMGISSYLLPWNSDIETMLAPITGDYEIIQNLNDFYQQGNQNGMLFTWDHKSGYFIKLNKPTQLPVYGHLTLDTDIYFSEGWNLIPVLFDTELDLQSYFGSQLDRVIIIRDAIGSDMYWPENNIGTLENLQPGRSYLVKVSEDFTLSCSPQPTQAWAGADQVNVPGTQTNLEGNIPEIGEGYWTVVSGNGGNIIDPTNPSSVFSGVVSETYLLEWRISNACGATADIVHISFQESVTTYIITTISEPPEGGITAGDGIYPEGDLVTVTATEAENYTFINWTDEYEIQISTEPSFEYTMPGEDVILIANFEEVQTGFTCGEPYTDPRDDQSYETVLIGDQCWLSENLNVGVMIDDGTNMTNNGQIEKYCYDNDPTKCQTYGGLYKWNEMMQYTTLAGAQGICPEGWHIPADNEWKILEGTVDSQNPVGDSEWDGTGLRGFDVGLNLKSANGWDNNGNGTNLYGFSALPGGFRSGALKSGLFTGQGINGHWWSSDPYYSGAWERGLFQDSDASERYNTYIQYSYSVRCLLNGTNPPTSYNLILEVEPAEAGTVQGSGQYEAGEEITVSATANPGWEFLYWTDEDDIQINTEPSFEYTMPDEDLTLTANFEKETTGFTCGEPFIDDRDGQSYETLQIGDQCWMAENLAYLPEVSPSSQASNTDPYYYVYNYQGTSVAEAKATTNYQTYGVLYNWPASMDACPSADGWHLPTDAEWAILDNYVISQPEYLCNDNTDYIAKALAATTNWNSSSITCAVGNNLSANDATGFSSLPGGNRNTIGNFYGIGDAGSLWTSTENSTTTAWFRGLNHYSTNVNRSITDKRFGMSVRCWRDGTNPPTTFNLMLEVEPAEAGTVQGSGQYEAGDVITVSTTANPGWDFVNWTDEDDVEVSTEPSFEYTMPGEEVIMTANFEEEQTGFTCGEPFTDDRDGQSYETVQIGDQCWLGENLNFGNFINGGTAMTNNGQIEKYCYDNLESNCDIYGALYQWDEMMQYSITPGSQGICPEGWHIPRDEEWKILEGTVDSQYPVGDPMWNNTGCRGLDAGKNLKSTTQWNNNGNGADIYNFTALPSGHLWTANGFILLGEVGFYFSSSKDGEIVIDRTMGAGGDCVYRWNAGIASEGRSVRCLKDE